MVVFKRRLIFIFLISLLGLWTMATYYFFMYRPKITTAGENAELLKQRLEELEKAIATQRAENERLLRYLNEHIQGKRQGIAPAALAPLGTDSAMQPQARQSIPIPKSFQPSRHDVIAILVFACNRPLAIKNHIDQLLKLRPSKEQFPVIVSQDCSHEETANAIRSYGDQLTYIKQPDQSDFDLPKKTKKFVGYYKIARHYHWALNQTFFNFGHQTVIMTEDDLDLAVDFFEYFMATYILLRLDPTLWCVSAWNDNGKAELIENKPDLLHRTDFFPGLGWMFRREVWEEIEPRWPITFWDDWMRQQPQRKDRACIRPEISRTAMSSHGKVGVSRGLYFDKHLKHIQLNSGFVNFTKSDLSYLLKDSYDEPFVKRVYSSPSHSLSEVQQGKTERGVKLPPTVRLTYETKDSFKAITKALKLMDDVKAGVPRTAYRGVVSFMYNGIRVYLAPPASWSGYDHNDWK